MKNRSLWIIASLLCFILLGVNYTNSHYAEIMGLRADYYFKKNDLSKAQECYEIAFEKGLNQLKQRDTYINSIINSPLTTEAQEKLVQFLNNPKEDVARVKTEYFLADLKREIHRKYPDNYITNAVFNQKIIRWGNFPITYSFVNKDNAPKYFIEEIEAAFTEWEKVTEHQILFSEDNKNPNITIEFKTENPADINDKKYVVAYTTPVIEIDKLKNMEILFYLKDSTGKNFSKNQVYNTALHEIAHALGFMGHCNDKNNIMYLTKDSISVMNDEREVLSEADINTMKLLYKIKPQITNTKNAIGEYIPYLVLGTEKEVNNDKIKEAKIYIRKAPNLPAGYVDLAAGYVAAKDYTKAIKYLKKALTLADTEDIRGMIYFNLAITNFYVDNLEDARNFLIKSMQIEDSDEKHYLLGEIYVREGKTKSAIREYTNLVKKNPQNIEYTIALANIYVINRDFFKARATLKTFFIHNPTQKNNSRFAPYGILKLGL